jgi:MOSC domain-containing protein YiiM
MVESASLLSVHIGRVAPLGHERVLSAFGKQIVTGAVFVTPECLEGDEQADHEAHGGPEKAVYGYAVSHYSNWAKEFPTLADRFVPGAMGENLCITGMNEKAVCVGDVHAIGSALLQVCQPRRPCFKLALRYDNKDLPQAMVRNGYSGWYYRVLRTGMLAAGNPVVLHDRPNPDFAFSRLIEFTNYGRGSKEELRRMAGMSGLASQWQMRAQKLLQGQS